MRLYYYKYVIIIINVINNIEYILIEEGKENKRSQKLCNEKKRFDIKMK
jgi:hypothetical protein